MARILGLSGSGVAGLRCAFTWPHMQRSKARNVMAMRVSGRREGKAGTVIRLAPENQTLSCAETQCNIGLQGWSFATLVSEPRPPCEGGYRGLTEGGDAGDALADY